MTVLLGGPAGSYTADVQGPVRGPLVVLLHGFPQSRHTWQQQVPALAAAGYRAVAPDQRGYSSQARPDPAELANYGIDRLMADVLALADAAGAEPGGRFHLVGHDWGGAVAWMVAAHHPDRLASLTVLSRPHPRAFAQALRADADGQQHRSRHHKAFQDVATGPKLLEDNARRLRRMLADQGVGSDAVEQYLSVVGTPGGMEGALAWYRATAGDLGQMSAGRVGVATLYVWGDNDASVGAEAARATQDWVDGPYRFVALAGVGHFVTDQQAPAVTELLLEHLAAHPVGEAGPG